jgi:hypothetical protein
MLVVIAVHLEIILRVERVHFAIGCQFWGTLEKSCSRMQRRIWIISRWTTRTKPLARRTLRVRRAEKLGS